MLNEHAESIAALRDALAEQDAVTTIQTIKELPKFRAIILFRDKLRKLLFDQGSNNVTSTANKLSCCIDFDLSALTVEALETEEFCEAIETYAHLVFKLVLAWQSEGYGIEECCKIVDGAKFYYG